MELSGDTVILKPYDGLAKPSTVQLDTIKIWLQIHDVPPLYAHMVPSLAQKLEKSYMQNPNHMTLWGISIGFGSGLMSISL